VTLFFSLFSLAHFRFFPSGKNFLDGVSGRRPWVLRSRDFFFLPYLFMTRLPFLSTLFRLRRTGFVLSHLGLTQYWVLIPTFSSHTGTPGPFETSSKFMVSGVPSRSLGRRSQVLASPPVFRLKPASIMPTPRCDLGQRRSSPRHVRRLYRPRRFPTISLSRPFNH